MKFLFDLFPVLLFFIAFQFAGIYVATGVAIAASFAQIGWLYAKKRKIDTMLWVSLVIISVFGGMTLFFHSDTFIKWKPTVLYASMAIVLAVALWGWGKNFLQMLLGSQLSLPDAVWARLTVIWVVYFLFMAAINGYVAALYSTEDWVNFKLWGYAFPLIFIVGQGFYISRHIRDDGPSEPPSEKQP